MIDDDERALFLSAMYNFHKVPHTTSDQTIRTDASYSWPRPHPDDAEPIGGESTLFYAIPNLPAQTIKKLKRGTYPIDCKVDLHGCTIEMSHDLLGNVIQQAQEASQVLLLIIHGKGNPQRSVLKTALNQSLRTHPAVLAFCSAQAKHGGCGALYVLLRTA